MRQRTCARRPRRCAGGRLPTPDTAPVARVAHGEAITFDTVSHEGLLGDQGADPVAFFGGWGIEPDEILDDVRDLAGTALGRVLPHDGPHAVLGPIEVPGARVGEMPRPGASGFEPPAVVSTLARVDDDERGRIDTPSGPCTPLRSPSVPPPRRRDPF
jgi:hypothetical protein